LLQEEFTAHEETVNCVAFGQKSGQILVTGGEDKKVNFWAVGQRKCLLVSTQFQALLLIECINYNVYYANMGENKKCLRSTTVFTGRHTVSIAS